MSEPKPRISWKAKAEELAAENAKLREAKRPVITAEHQAEIQKLVWGRQDQSDLEKAQAEIASLKRSAESQSMLWGENMRLRAELRQIKRWARKLKL